MTAEAPAVPGTALAVIHNWRVVPRPHGRCAVECSCQPDRAIAVGEWASWDAVLVLSVHRQHKAVCDLRIAEAERELETAREGRGSWARNALARSVQKAGAK